MVDAFASNSFLAMIENPKHSAKVGGLCEFVLDQMQEAGLPASAEPPFAECFERIRLAVSGILAIYTPVPGYGGSTVKDACDLLDFSGECVLLEGVRDVIEGTEEWREQANDLVKFAPNSMRLGPELKELTKACIRDAGEPTVTESYQKALASLPGMTKDLREGAMNDLEELLAKWTAKIVDGFASVEDAGSVDPIDVASVGKMISLLQRHSGMSDLQLRFQKWQDKMSKGLAGKQLKAFVDEYVHEDAGEGSPPPEVDYANMETLLKRCQKEEVLATPGIQMLPPVCLRSFISKAGVGRFSHRL